MKEVLYLEIPTPHTEAVKTYLQQEWQPIKGKTIITPDGIRLQFFSQITEDNITPNCELSVFVWSLQRTTYLKMFQWGEKTPPQLQEIKSNLTKSLQNTFPQQYPIPPDIDLSQQSIFEGLASFYPQTVHFFKKFPQGEYDLTRAYWWEKRWRDSVNNPQHPKEVIFRQKTDQDGEKPSYDLIYIGGALGVIHGAVMAQKGYKVLLIERLPFGRMNREWNISRQEFESLIDLGLFTPEEFEGLIAQEYVDGFNKFFDGNNPTHLKAEILHTPTVLNIALNSEKLLQMCGEKLLQAGGEIWDETEFIRGDITPQKVILQLVDLKNKEAKEAKGRLLIDAMGTASPIAWQLNGGRTFDSVCPTVGAVIDKSCFPPEVWDPQYGDVLNSHGDISRGRQLIWELFPGENEDLTFYLFHYHEVHPDNPGSLLEMYEDFFSIIPEYRRCEMEDLIWKKATFGYIPGHFSVGGSDRLVGFDRVLAIGDAASLQSPLVFTGFGSLVRNLGRLTDLLDTALKYDLLQGKDLNLIRAYQSNISVTWLFSKGMMVKTGTILPPQRINCMLNTFFGILALETQEVANTFIKDRTNWLLFNRLALKAASQNPAMLIWILEMAGIKDIMRWLISYLIFTFDAFLKFILMGWFPNLLNSLKPWLMENNPSLWLKCLSFYYRMKSLDKFVSSKGG
jgi:lycopene cyclase CruA